MEKNEEYEMDFEESKEEAKNNEKIYDQNMRSEEYETSKTEEDKHSQVSFKPPEKCEKVVKENISLENFDPFNPRKILDSPRSLQVCELNGIVIKQLFHSSMDEIKAAAHPLKKIDLDYIRVKYIETENQRQRLVEYLRMQRLFLVRNQDNKFPNNITALSASPASSMFSTNLAQWGSKTRRARCASNTSLTEKRSTNFNDVARLDRSVVEYERHRINSKTNKEIKVLFDKLQQQLPLPSQEYGRSSSKHSESRPRRAKSNLEHGDYCKEFRRLECFRLQQRETAIIKKMEKAFLHSNAKREENKKIIKQKKILKDIQLEQHREMKQSIDRILEYRRDLIQKQLNRVQEKSEGLQHQRMELSRLRQKMRKDADFRKHQARSEIEKIKLRCKNPDGSRKIDYSKLGMSRYYPRKWIDNQFSLFPVKCCDWRQNSQQKKINFENKNWYRRLLMYNKSPLEYSPKSSEPFTLC